MDYGVSLTNSADSDLNKLDPQIKNEVEDELFNLGDQPEAGQTLANTPNKIRSYHFKHLSVSGEYRAAYVIDYEKNFCYVFAIGSRENFYEKVKQRAQHVLKEI